MKNTTIIGNSGSQYQLSTVSQGTPSSVARPCDFWAATISLRFSEPAQSSTVTMTKPMETS